MVEGAWPAVWLIVEFHVQTLQEEQVGIMGNKALVSSRGLEEIRL